ncbi:IS5/IS1182 family transposase [Candidatus Woesearchaeota archaeon CG10_big_fil_rev_8_21_14_0_10_33_12]|nr:MAG: IS5/IS1182 family transposase [Candidatus Woesearchaeota archaeon CG10_big_fil_rev_8_21_14_0_10_33_12]
MAKKKRGGKKWQDNRDWKAYNEQLVKRGEFYINPRFLETWLKEIREMNHGKAGQPYMYPESLIEFFGVLKAKGFSLRDLQGVVQALSKRFNNFPVICFSQIRRRVLKLPLSFNAKGSNLVTGIDGSGMKVSNRGEWIRQKWAVRRGWIKVVILGDVDGNIVDIRVGNEDVDERAAGRGMVCDNKENIEKVLADGLHDCEATFDLCGDFELETGIKIRENANESGLGARPDEVRLYKNLGEPLKEPSGL